MSHSEPEELIQAKKLMEDGKFDEALQIMNEIEEKEGLSNYEQISYYILKSSISSLLFKKAEFIKYSKMAFTACQGQEPNLQQLDAYIVMTHAFLYDMKHDKARELIIICEDIFKILFHEPQIELTRREALIAYIKAMIFNDESEFDRALEYAEQALALRENLDLKVDIISSLSQIKVIYWAKGDLDNALEYAERCLTRAIEIDYLLQIQLAHTTFGLIYLLKGELKISLDNQKKALTIAEQLKEPFLIAASLINLGLNYQQQGEIALAQEHFERSYELFQKAGSPGFTVLDSLFHLAMDKGDLEGAKAYLDQLEQLKDKLDWKVIDVVYRVNKAVYLKTSPRSINRGKAEEMLKKVCEEEIIVYDSTIIALLHLCDLLLSELSNVSTIEIIDELKLYISKLTNFAEKNHSFLVLAETYLLQARLALLTLDLKETRLLLTKAQNIAERYGLSRLAIKISREHDAFLKQQNVWENMNKDDVNLVERIELSGINQQMDSMLRKKEIEFPKVSDEDPVVILIVSESGEVIFSQSFTESWTFEDDVLGSFLSAINSFSDELFSEGLDRAVFGQYSILMKSASPFLVCYLFKGESYLAQHRIRHFVDRLQNDHLIWETFNQFYQTNQVIQAKDIPTLNPLITEIFIDKNFPLVN